MGHSVLFLLLILMLNVLYENTREQKAKAPRSCVLIKKSEMQLYTSLPLDFHYKLLNNKRNICST